MAVAMMCTYTYPEQQRDNQFLILIIISDLSYVVNVWTTMFALKHEHWNTELSDLLIEMIVCVLCSDNTSILILST